uniref:Uncharacterized protein n=1 Tax=Solanum tuberosum TaxID=4113 RepID=M1BM34_SOLTU
MYTIPYISSKHLYANSISLLNIGGLTRYSKMQRGNGKSPNRLGEASHVRKVEGKN